MYEEKSWEGCAEQVVDRRQHMLNNLKALNSITYASVDATNCIPW